MAIPTHYLMMRPVLELAARQDITRRSVEPAMRDHFHLTEEEMALRVPSGQHGLTKDRAGWAMTYLKKAGLLVKVAPKTYRATESGLAFPARPYGRHQQRRPGQDRHLPRVRGRVTGETRSKGSESQVALDASDEAHTPDEVIGGAVATSIPMSVSDSWKRSSRKTPSFLSIWCWMS